MAEAQTAPARTEQDLVSVTIDGIPYRVPKGANLLDVCLKAGREEADYPDQSEEGPHYVPHFCWHPGLSVSGNCRMCFVKTRQMVKRGDQLVPMEMMTTACTNLASEGLEIDTRSPEVQKVRAGIMDLELINHPLDCPECDKAGECRLQDYDYEYGHDHSKFDFEKVKSHIKPLGEKITIWGTRCIQCSRCVRFCDEVTGTSELALVNRGDRTVIDIFPGQPIENDLALNTVEVCPVGALKNRDFLYTARVWNLDRMPGVCGLCAKGCNIRVDSLKGEVKRVMARENRAVNDYWICDRARLDYGWINSEKRLDRPRTKEGEIGWESGYAKALEMLRGMAENASRTWAVAHASLTNEELWLLKKLCDRQGIKNLALVAAPDVKPFDFPGFKAPADGNANRNGAAVVLGIGDAEESAKAFRKAVEAGEATRILLFGGLPHGAEGLDELTKALGADSVKEILLLDFRTSLLSELAQLTLATTTSVENGGSWVNADMRVQAFRAALPFARCGRPSTEVLQELLWRLDGGDASPAKSTDTASRAPAGEEGDPPKREFAKPKPQRKVILGPAALFDELAAEIPQFSGHSHLSLIRSGGAALMG